MWRALFCVIVGVVATVSDTGQGCDQSPAFDYYLFVQQYAPSFPGNEAHDYFTVHGLWPSRNGNHTLSSYPCFCHHADPDLEPGGLSSALQRDLRTFWPTLMPGHSNEWFWSHEWGKHGTCAVTLPTATAYFQTTLDLRAQYDLRRVLPLSLLDSRQYSPEVIRQTVRAHYSVTPLVSCHHHTMLSIALCVDRHSHQVVECSPAVLHGSFNTCDSGP